METSERKTMLLDTFDLLKDDFYENKISLRDIVDKMSKIDFEIAIEMWKYLIKENPDDLHETDDLGFPILFSLTQNVGESKVYNYIYEDSFLKEKLYVESGGKDREPLEAIRYFLHNNELEKANELLELSLMNKYSGFSSYEVILYSIPFEDEQVTTEVLNLIKAWISKVNDEKGRAKLQLRLLDYMDNGIKE